MAKTKDKVLVSAYMPLAYDLALDQLAKNHERSKSYFLRKALEQLLAQYPEITA